MLPASLKSLKNLFGLSSSHIPVKSVTPSARVQPASKDLLNDLPLQGIGTLVMDSCFLLMAQQNCCLWSFILNIKLVGCWEVSCGTQCVGASQAYMLLAILYETALPGMSAVPGDWTGRARLSLELHTEGREDVITPLQWVSGKHGKSGREKRHVREDRNLASPFLFHPDNDRATCALLVKLWNSFRWPRTAQTGEEWKDVHLNLTQWETEIKCHCQKICEDI